MSQTVIELQPPSLTTYSSNLDQLDELTNGSDSACAEPQLHEGIETVVTNQKTAWQVFATIVTISGVTGISGLLGGIVIVAIPAIAADIELDRSLLMW